MFDIEKYEKEITPEHYALMVECKKRMESNLSSVAFSKYSDIERSAVVSGIKGGFLDQVRQIVEMDAYKKQKAIDSEKEKERLKKQRERVKATSYEFNSMLELDSTLIPDGRRGEALKMRLAGYSYRHIANHYNLSTQTIRKDCYKAIFEVTKASRKNEENGNDKQEVPVNDISESDFNESGLCASGYILRLRDIARNLSSQ